MRVHNITDAPTQSLKAAGLVSVSLRVGGTIIKPGESAVVSSLGTNADRYISVGAIHVGDKPPVGYTSVRKPAASQKVLNPYQQVFVTSAVKVIPADPSHTPEGETKADRKKRYRLERQGESSED